MTRTPPPRGCTRMASTRFQRPANSASAVTVHTSAIMRPATSSVRPSFTIPGIRTTNPQFGHTEPYPVGSSSAHRGHVAIARPEPRGRNKPLEPRAVCAVLPRTPKRFSRAGGSSESMFASRANLVELSGIRKMFERAPPDSINLGLGEPDFQPPPHILDALDRAVRRGQNKYGPTG